MREADRKRKNKIKNPAKAQEENCTLPDSASTRVCLKIRYFHEQGGGAVLTKALDSA